MQRREQQAEQHDHQAAEPGHRAVDLGVQARLDLMQFGAQCRLDALQVLPNQLEILLGGDVVVDGVEDLGGNALGRFTLDVGVGKGVGQ
jgi:hypothetical protein